MGPVRTVYLGQFTEDHAARIAAALDRAGITWWAKRSGRLIRLLFVGEWGVRLFVAADALDRARAIVERVLAEDR